VSLARVLTGGQTGVDRAATDVAIARGIAHGGWVPRGGWAEDFPVPPGVLAAYAGFTETESDDPAVRTIRNVDDADAVLVVTLGRATSPGTRLAVARAAEQGKRLVEIDLDGPGAVGQLAAFLGSLGDGCVLNVAGPRESEQPGIYAAVRTLLGNALDDER
jgi:Circularly permutated YpsA SLOG family